MALRVTSNVRKAGLSGLFLLALTTLTFAEPLKIEVRDATADRDMRTGEPVVTIRMKAESAKAFAALTQRNVGKLLELRIDGKVVMTAVVREMLLSGTMQVSGKLTPNDASDMVRKIKAGAAVEVEPPEAPR